MPGGEAADGTRPRSPPLPAAPGSRTMHGAEPQGKEQLSRSSWKGGEREGEEIGDVVYGPVCAE